MAANDDFGVLGSFFEWAGDIFSDEEKENFVKEVMSRRGHKPVLQWADGDGKSDNKKTGNVLGITSGGRKASGSGPGWQYGS